MSVAEQEQQLSAVVGQQEALKEVVTRLAATLEGTNQTAANADVQELTKQVGWGESLCSWYSMLVLTCLLPASIVWVWNAYPGPPVLAPRDLMVLQVLALSKELAQLKAAAAVKADTDALADKLQDLAQKTEDRQARAETAIYQVRLWQMLLRAIQPQAFAATCEGMRAHKRDNASKHNLICMQGQLFSSS